MTERGIILSLVIIVLLAIWLTNCAPDAHAEWEHIPGTEVIGSVGTLESDGLRLYAISDTGFYFSFDDGYTWRRREIGRGIDDFYITTIGSGDGAVYVGTTGHGVIRSEDGGNTWKHINEGLHIFDDPKWGSHYGRVEQILVTDSGMVINVGYHFGTHISRDRGETWSNVIKEWKAPRRPGKVGWAFGSGIWSMTEFNGYLWAVYSSAPALRSPDDGGTWEILPTRNYGGIRDFGRVYDWAVLGDRLYVSGQEGFGRWSEMEGEWEYLTEGLPFGRDPPHLMNLAVNRGRIFTALYNHGVYMFDVRSETWISVGLRELSVTALVSHKSDLYAATKDGIYRASIPIVHSYGKAPTTWGALKSAPLSLSE